MKNIRECEKEMTMFWIVLSFYLATCSRHCMNNFIMQLFLCAKNIYFHNVHKLMQFTCSATLWIVLSHLYDSNGNTSRKLNIPASLEMPVLA